MEFVRFEESRGRFFETVHFFVTHGELFKIVLSRNAEHVMSFSFWSENVSLDGFTCSL